MDVSVSHLVLVARKEDPSADILLNRLHDLLLNEVVKLELRFLAIG